MPEELTLDTRSGLATRSRPLDMSEYMVVKAVSHPQGHLKSEGLQNGDWNRNRVKKNSVLWG